MGIKGTVRRSTDGDFIHANVDIGKLFQRVFPSCMYLRASLVKIGG